MQRRLLIKLSNWRLNMASIYELTGEFLTLLSMAADEEVDAEAFADTLEGIDFEIEMKADGYAKIMKNITADADGIAEEIKRLQARKKSLENKADALKKNLEKCMITTGKTKFKTQLFSFGIQKNPASLVIDSEDDIPPEYLIPRMDVDKESIKNALKDGQQFAFAHLEQKESLRIR